MSGHLYCACGCGELLVGKRRHARYLDGTHRKRGNRNGDRAAESVTLADPDHGSPDSLGTVSGGCDDALTTAEAMRRLDALSAEFDRGGYTEPMRREALALVADVRLPKPRWLARHDFDKGGGTMPLAPRTRRPDGMPTKLCGLCPPSHVEYATARAVEISGPWRGRPVLSSSGT